MASNAQGDPKEVFKAVGEHFKRKYHLKYQLERGGAGGVMLFPDDPDFDEMSSPKVDLAYPGIGGKGVHVHLQTGYREGENTRVDDLDVEAIVEAVEQLARRAKSGILKNAFVPRRVMDKVASPNELAAELRRLLAYAGSEKPSREKLAAEMRGLAARIEKVAARKGEVIESKRWKHKESGATASLFGAVPWSGAPGDRKEDWQLEGVGWTIRWDDGTVGIGRQPFKSKAEAEEHLEKMRGKGLAK